MYTVSVERNVFSDVHMCAQLLGHCSQTVPCALQVVAASCPTNAKMVLTSATCTDR